MSQLGSTRRHSIAASRSSGRRRHKKTRSRSFREYLPVRELIEWSFAQKSEEKRTQIIALGQLGWSLRRIQKTTGVRRETAATYLKAAEITLRPPGGWGKRPASNPANRVTTDPKGEQSANPANRATADSASACAPYRELIEQGLEQQRNAMSIWQQLVDQHGFAGSYESVKRYVRKRRGRRP